MALSLSRFAAVWLCGKLVVLRIVGQGAPGGGLVAGDESISLGCMAGSGIDMPAKAGRSPHATIKRG